MRRSHLAPREAESYPGLLVQVGAAAHQDLSHTHFILLGR